MPSRVSVVTEGICVGGGQEKGEGLPSNTIEHRICFWAGWYTTSISYGIRSGRGNLRRREGKGDDFLGNAVEVGLCSYITHGSGRGNLCRKAEKGEGLLGIAVKVGIRFWPGW